MLYLICTADGKQFAIEARFVVEVLPRVRLLSLSHQHHAVMGLLDFHGHQIPALDLARMIHPDADPISHCGRIVVVQLDLRSGQNQTVDGQLPPRFALCVETATELIRKRPDEFTSPAAGLDWAPDRRINRVTKSSIGIIQWIDLNSIFEGDLSTSAFSQDAI